MGLVKKAKQYIKEHGEDLTPEQLFEQFETVCMLHKHFEEYLKETGINYTLNAMRRNERLKAKRKVFVEWYLQRHPDKQAKVAWAELSEFTFMSERTVEYDMFYANYGTTPATTDTKPPKPVGRPQLKLF